MSRLPLTRSSSGILAGVCKGLAKRFDIDVLLARVLFLGSVLFLGFGLGIYILLAFSLPKDDAVSTAYEPRLMGVCSRLSLRFDLDVGLVRFLMLLLFFSSLGTTLFFYIILYFVLPQRDEMDQR